MISNDNSVIYSNNNSLDHLCLNRSEEDIQDSTDVYNIESDVLDDFQTNNILISNINPKILDDILQTDKIDIVNPDNIMREQSLSQTQNNLYELIENPSSLLPQLPPKKKRSKYLNPDSEWLTIPLDQICSKSKIGLLPNGGIIISGCGSQGKENENTYNLSNTCGFDSIMQLIAVAFCDSSTLREQVLQFDNIPEIELAIDLSKTNTINKNILNKRFNILKNIFDTTKMPNNMIRINCDCNVVKVLKDLKNFSLSEIKKCSNVKCKQQL